ncbi:MAG: radical SAM protein [Candidatus Omnitrophica bacterium]|nr:radical SAM protein [Candidatus Omnitrophota bacterium]
MNKYVPAMLPLSIGFLAGFLLSKKAPFSIIDEQIEYISKDRISRLTHNKGAIIIGLSCLTAGATRSYELAGWIKAANPDATVIYGGVHATVLPEEALRTGSGDIVVRHEGEETLWELARALGTGSSLDDIQGISFIRDGAVVHTPDRPLIGNLDELPPFPYHLFEKDIGRYDFGNLLTSRGCPFECIFCSQRSISGRFYRYRSADNILCELDTLIYRYHQKKIIFNDDNFVVNRGHVFSVCAKIIDRKYPKTVSFLAMARADMVDKELLTIMKKAGFVSIAYGLESGSDRLLKLVKKGLSTEDNKRAVRMTHEAGISTYASFILGLPTETKEESSMTIKFARDIPLDMTRFNLLVPYPGTPVHDLVKEKLGTGPAGWDNFITVSGFMKAGIPYIPDGRTENEMRRLQMIANLAFYARPARFMKLVREGFGSQLRLPPLFSLRGIRAYSELILYFTLMLARSFMPVRSAFKPPHDKNSLDNSKGRLHL